jgi:Holliday junction resolvasome RuvABC endonuclease subunit
LSCVLGIDLSSHAIDLVLLDETTNHATWHFVDLGAGTALDRLRRIPAVMPKQSWYDDIYLAAIEAPYGRGHTGTLAKLSRVFGAIAATLPQALEVWEVTPGQWRKTLGLPGNAPKSEIREAIWKLPDGPSFTGLHENDGPTQDALDAYAIAYYARNTNQRGIAA